KHAFTCENSTGSGLTDTTRPTTGIANDIEVGNIGLHILGDRNRIGIALALRSVEKCRAVCDARTDFVEGVNVFDDAFEYAMRISKGNVAAFGLECRLDEIVRQRLSTPAGTQVAEPLNKRSAARQHVGNPGYCLRVKLRIFEGSREGLGHKDSEVVGLRLLKHLRVPGDQHVFAVIFRSDKSARIGAEVSHYVVGMTTPIIELGLIESPVNLFREIAACLDTHTDVYLSRVDVQLLIKGLLRKPVCATTSGGEDDHVEDLFGLLTWPSVPVIGDRKLFSASLNRQDFAVPVKGNVGAP